MLRIMNTSQGWNPDMLEGHTLESAQAITKNCTWIYQLRVKTNVLVELQHGAVNIQEPKKLS